MKRLLFAVLFFFAFSSLHAQTDLIDNSNDSGADSFRQAILDENSAAASSATFAIGAAGSQQVIMAGESTSSPLPVITANNTSFLNTYNGQIILDGSDISAGTSILLNAQATGVSIQGVYFRNLATTNSAIYVNGSLDMTDGDIINCATGMGAVYVAPDSAFNLHITSNYLSQSATLGFVGNSTTNAAGGADLYLDTGSTATVNLNSGVTYGFYDNEAIGGPGSLALQGSGTLNLPTANSYSGGTFLAAGTLVASNNNSLGTGPVTIGEGTLNLHGGVTLTNALYMIGGTLSASVLGDYAGNIQVVSNAAFSAPTTADILLVDGNLSGAGNLAVTGLGTVVLNGDDISFSGNLALASGANLEVGDINHPSAILNAGLTVSTGASLSGVGTLEGAVVNNGLVYPGAVGVTPNLHVGTLTVGNYTQSSSGTLAIDVLGNSSAQLESIGSANLGGALLIEGTGPSGVVRRDYEFLTATQGVTGTFANFSGTIAGFNTTLGYGADAVTLTLTLPTPLENPSQASAISPNEMAVLTALTQALPTAGSSLVNKIQEIYDLRVAQTTPAGQQAAMDSILANFVGPAYASNAQAMVFNQVTGQFSSLQSFLRQQLGGPLLSSLSGWMPGGVALDAMGPGMTASPEKGGQGLWFDNEGSFGSTAGTANLQAFNQNSNFFNGGYDMSLGGGLTGGLRVGYLQSQSASADGLSGTNLSGWQAGLYGAQKMGPVDFGAEGTFGINHYQTTRTIPVWSDVSQAQGAFDGNQIGLSAQGGLPLKAGDVKLEPFLGAQWSRVSLDAFTETGADPLDLIVPAQAYNALSPFLGVNGTRDYPLGRNLKLTPFAALTASWDVLNQTPSYEAALTGAPNDLFLVTGNKPDPFLLGVGAGFQLTFYGQFNLFAEYNGFFNGSENLNSFKGGLDLAI
jgi:autotransporter-associated beta strand protein